MLFIDSADPKEISRWFEAGVVSGVTTNPILIQRALGTYPDRDALREHIAQILEAVDGPYPVSVQLTSESLVDMLREAEIYCHWDQRIVIKVPFSVAGLQLTNVLADMARVQVNMTGLMSFGQVVLAQAAGAHLASLFMCRMMDQNLDAVRIIRAAADYTEKTQTSVLVGSIRLKVNVEKALAYGADIVTVPPQVLETMLDEPGTTKVLEEFRVAAKSAAIES